MAKTATKKHTEKELVPPGHENNQAGLQAGTPDEGGAPDPLASQTAPAPPIATPAEKELVSPAPATHEPIGVGRITDNESDIVAASIKSTFEVPAAPREMISVDKALFYRAIKMCVQGYGDKLNKGAGVTKFGAMLGATNAVEAKVEWDKAQRYLETHK